MAKDEIKEDAKPIPDKETKPETIDTDSKTEKTESKGEYVEYKEPAMEVMKEYYGEDVEINDDNYGYKMEEMVVKDYKPMKEKMGKYESANKNILAMMESEPELSGILSDMSQGAKFSETLPKYMDVQALVDSKGGDEAAWEENNKARMSNYEKMQAHKAQMAANEEKSLKTVKKFMADKKLEGENAEMFGKFIADVIDRANSGDLTEQFLESMYYGMNYKKDVAMAEELGKVSERNKKIEETVKSEAELQGDKLPKIKSADEKVAMSDTGDFADKLEKSLKTRKSIV